MGSSNVVDCRLSYSFWEITTIQWEFESLSDCCYFITADAEIAFLYLVIEQLCHSRIWSFVALQTIKRWRVENKAFVRQCSKFEYVYLKKVVNIFCVYGREAVLSQYTGKLSVTMYYRKSELWIISIWLTVKSCWHVSRISPQWPIVECQFTTAESHETMKNIIGPHVFHCTE